MSRQKSFNLLPNKTFIQIMYVYKATRKHFVLTNFISGSI